MLTEQKTKGKVRKRFNVLLEKFSHVPQEHLDEIIELYYNEYINSMTQSKNNVRLYVDNLCKFLENATFNQSKPIPELEKAGFYAALVVLKSIGKKYKHLYRYSLISKIEAILSNKANIKKGTLEIKGGDGKIGRLLKKNGSKAITQKSKKATSRKSQSVFEIKSDFRRFRN